MERELVVDHSFESITLKNIPNIIWKADIDQNGDFVNTYISPVADELLNLPVGTIKNSWDKFFNYICDQYVEKLLEALADGIKNVGKVISIEYKVIKGDNSKAWFLSEGRSYQEDGKIKIFGYTSDITIRKQNEKKLIKSEKYLKEMSSIKDRIFSIIGHDLKSPLTGVMGVSELLLTNYDQFQKMEALHFINLIYENVKRTMGLLDNLLTWSKFENKRLGFLPEYIDIERSIDRVIKLCGSCLKLKRIDIVIDICESCKTVFTDSFMFETILRNLISNSVKFSSKGGVITLKTELFCNKKGDFILFSVEDKGVGLSPIEINQILKGDNQFSKLGTEREKGTGLGLIIVKKFIQKNGGDFWIESELKKGSKFKFTLKKG